MPPTRPRAAARDAILRSRAQLAPVVQTAVAAALAWTAARLLLGSEQPAFAAIAAVIAVGATYGERPARALQLVAGVVLGLAVADVLIRAIGTGAPQLGVTVGLAMLAAVLLGGGALLVTEAGVSAILLMTLAPETTGLLPVRALEAVIGGVVALGVSALAFPLDPRLHAGRATNALVAELTGALETLASALERRDREGAELGLAAARELDGHVRALEEALSVGEETAALAPVRRGARRSLRDHRRAVRHLDFAVRNVRVLARHVSRFVRADRPAPAALPLAIRELKGAIWAVASELEEPERGSDLRRHALAAVAATDRVWDAEGDLGLAEVVVQVRSTAVDLLRASEALDPDREPAQETPTEELLGAGR